MTLCTPFKCLWFSLTLVYSINSSGRAGKHQILVSHGFLHLLQYKKFKKAAVWPEECNSWILAGRNASGMWVPPLHYVANIVGFTSGPEELRHLCGCKSCSELVLESWWVILETYSSGMWLCLTQCSLKASGLGLLPPSGTTECGRGRKSLILAMRQMYLNTQAWTVTAPFEGFWKWAVTSVGSFWQLRVSKRLSLRQYFGW